MLTLPVGNMMKGRRGASSCNSGSSRLLYVCALFGLLVVCLSWLPLQPSSVLLFTKVEASAPAEKPAKEEEEAVLTLTKDNFDSTLEKNEVVLVEFYAPWCGHCKKLAPEYELAAKKLKSEGSAVKLGKVDATQETELADKYGVRGYPTLQMFRKKVPEEYSGGRTADTIVEWIAKMTGPAVTMIDAESLKTLRDGKTPVLFVGQFKSKEAEGLATFQKLADVSRQEGKFVAYVGEDAAEKVVVLRGDEEEVVFEGKTEEELKKFIGEESFALFGSINGENFKNYAERAQELIWFCGEAKDFEKVKAPVREAAKKYRADYSFVWLDTEQFKGHAENALGVTTFPALVYQSKKGRFILPKSEHLTEAAKIIQFLEDVKDGKVERDLKSEPVPEKNEDPVKIVVGKNFEELVLQKEKDVLLEVYAPWCGHCKKLEPVYKELAESLKDVEHVVIAKMDGTSNEAPVEDFDWTGFPTLFFVKAGTRSPLKFDGGRTLEGMFEYIKKHSSKTIKAEIIKPAKKEDVGREEL